MSESGTLGVDFLVILTCGQAPDFQGDRGLVKNKEFWTHFGELWVELENLYFIHGPICL